MEKRLEKMEIELKVARQLLSLQPTIKDIRRLVIPSALLSLNYPPEIKMLLSLKFGLTVYARVIRKRLEEADFSVDDFVRIFNYLSNIGHPQEGSIPPATDLEWDVILDEVYIFDPKRRTGLKCVLTPVSDVDIKQVEVLPHEHSVSDSILYIQRVPFDLKTVDRLIYVESKLKEVRNNNILNFFIAVSFQRKQIFSTVG